MQAYFFRSSQLCAFKFRFIFSIFIIFIGIMPTHAKRIALVIGNDNYSSVSKLQKAGNDATSIGLELKAAGFSVQLHKDLNYRGMIRAVEVFANSIAGGDEVLVFFAGHGIQIKSGNYLLPIDIEAGSETEVEKTAYDLNTLSEKIREAKPAFTMIILDACRDNPLKTKGRSIGNARGLDAFEAPKGQIIIYSASKGQQALDRLNETDSNPNGVFTREFIARMKKPGVKSDDFMREGQEAVETLASSVSHEQRPAIYNEARGSFYFFVPTASQMSGGAGLSTADVQKDEKYWNEVKAIANRDAYEAYLQRYPNGMYANLAKANLTKLSDGKVFFGTSAKPRPLTATIALQELYEKATEKNDASAQVTLGRSYQFGWSGLDKDDFEASRLFRLSADQGNPSGQAHLAHFYREGRGGLTQNFSEALRLTLLSAKNGDSMAQEHLGWLFSAGLAGAAKDDIQSLHWTRLSAAQGEWNSENRLGVFYRDGRGGLEKSDVEAAKWFKVAADKGHADARLNLASFYEHGRGNLTKDKDEAIRLYQFVARGVSNSDAGKRALQRLGATW